MSALEDLAAAMLQWKSDKRREIEKNVANPRATWESLASDMRAFSEKDKSAADASRSVMPEVRAQGAKETWQNWQDVAGGIGNIIGKAGKGAHEVTRAKRVVGTTGQYVGAPPGLDSPQKLGALVTKYKETAAAGLPGREFYRNSSRDIWERAGSDQELSDNTVASLAYLSRANNVGGNSSMGANAAVQAATGTPIRTGRFPSKDSPAIQQIYDSGQRGYAGHKRDPFAEQLSVRWAPERVGRGVNDMHEAEIMGYPSGKVGGPTQHAFMDEARARAITLANREKLGGFDDWDTGTIQAAAWTGNKIRRGEVAPGDAAKDYAYYLPRAQANATYESFPGAGSGHLAQAPGSDYAAKEWFHSLAPWGTSASGRDIGYTAAKLLPGEDVAAVGRFGQEVNPATVARPLTAIENADAGPVVADYSKKALDLVEGARAYADVQNAGAWHKVMRSKAGDYSAVAVRMPGMSEGTMKEIAPLFEGKGYDLASAPGGFTVLSLADDAPKGEAMAKEIRKLAKSLGAEGVEPGRLESGYIDYADAWKAGEGSDAATRKLLELVDQSPTAAKALESSDAYRAAVLARNPRDVAAQAAGWGDPRADVMRAREIFAKDGFAGLRNALGKGLLPAGVIAALGLSPDDERLQ